MSNAEWNQLECIWHFLGSFENSIKLIFWNPLSNNLFCTLLFNRNKQGILQSQKIVPLLQILQHIWKLNSTNIFKFFLIYFILGLLRILTRTQHDQSFNSRVSINIWLMIVIFQKSFMILAQIQILYTRHMNIYTETNFLFTGRQ